MSLPDDDPGWGLGALLAGESALLTMRQVWLAFCNALVVFFIVLSVMELESDDPPFSPEAGAIGLLALGFVLVFVSWQLLRDLPCANIGALLGGYRNRFFVRLAFAEISALLGFAAALVTGSLLPYLGGVVPTIVGFARVAPTRANLQAEDEALRDRSCPHSLSALLRDARFGTGG
ncbi:MAG TPA: hypothetical protein VJ804_09405 [Acidimicrobiales bacterium]|nr:hypothetical protein [Acidimicrobiales bacterium]